MFSLAPVFTGVLVISLALVASGLSILFCAALARLFARWEDDPTEYTQWGPDGPSEWRL